MRWLVAHYVGPRVPFITFYPAIIVAALLGGLGPGIVATMLSTVAAWHFFFPSDSVFSLGTQEAIQLLLFLFISAVNVAIAVVLNGLVERLVVQQRNIRLLLDAAPSGFLLVDEAGTIMLANASIAKTFGYKPEELAGKPVELLVPQSHQDGHRRLRLVYQQNPEARAMGAGRDLNGQRKDGGEVPVEIGLNPIEQDGRQAVLATVLDISERKRVEHGQRLLIRELEHRTRNLFSVLHPLIVTTARDRAGEGKELVQDLTGRVQSSAQTYNLFSASSQNLSLAKLVSIQMAALPGRVRYEGDDVLISPRMAEQFALIIHELRTNALKHGALSGSGGNIVVIGSLQGDGFAFFWRESGGPAVTPPTRRGFGTAIVQDAARQHFRQVVVEYLSSGLHYQVHADVRDLQPQAIVPSPAARATRVGAWSKGQALPAVGSTLGAEGHG